MVLLLEFGTASDLSAQQPGRQALQPTLAFELVSGFLVVVEGRIGPLQPLRFLLDTGTMRTIVDKKTADRLSLPRQKGRVLNFDKYRDIEWAEFPEVQVGPIRAQNKRMMVGDLKQYSEFATDVDAVIGLDVLGMSARLQIDYAEKRVTFEMPSAASAAAPEPPQVLTVRLTVQGQLLRLVIDTGLQGMLLYEDRLLKRSVQLKLANSAEAHQGRLSGEAGTLSGIRLGADEMESRVFLIRGAPDSLPAGIDGYLGTSAVNANIVELDFATHTFRWREGPSHSTIS